MLKNLFIYSLIFIFMVCGLGFFSSQAQEEGGDMKKVVMIIAPQVFRDEELLEPKAVFEKNGLEVTIASSSLNESRGMLGAKVKPDILIQDIKVADFAAIIFVGGSGSSCYWQDPVAYKIAKEANSSGKVVAAICIAPVTLANAGILVGKRATVFSSEAGKLKAKGAQYTAQPVEKDGNIITGSGPAAAKEFAQEILEAIK